MCASECEGVWRREEEGTVRIQDKKGGDTLRVESGEEERLSRREKGCARGTGGKQKRRERVHARGLSVSESSRPLGSSCVSTRRTPTVELSQPRIDRLKMARNVPSCWSALYAVAQLSLTCSERTAWLRTALRGTLCWTCGVGEFSVAPTGSDIKTDRQTATTSSLQSCRSHTQQDVWASFFASFLEWFPHLPKSASERAFALVLQGAAQRSPGEVSLASACLVTAGRRGKERTKCLQPLSDNGEVKSGMNPRVKGRQRDAEREREGEHKERRLCLACHLDRIIGWNGTRTCTCTRSCAAEVLAAPWLSRRTFLATKKRKAGHVNCTNSRFFGAIQRALTASHIFMSLQYH